KGLEAAGEVDQAKLRDAIEATQGFVGTAGIFNYSARDHNGLTVDAFVWVKIEDGKWKLAE
ncbi:MAG TPA: ABC transporter substrate-binding protein, partial [Armatimonadota bacterium]|nr:ABC transporter substrate-binding protein [Armatimonadota bacterium]